MNLKETLFEFEKKYPFLYEIEVKGVPIYTCFRDMVLLILDGKSTEKSNDFEIEKGRIYPKRIIDSYMKLPPPISRLYIICYIIIFLKFN